MIQNIIINGLHIEVDEDLEKYIKRKIGNLDKYLSRHSRENVRAEVKIKEVHSHNQKTNVCEGILYLPKKILKAEESTLNMFAAVDIVEAKLKDQLIKHKTQLIHSKVRKRWALRHQNQ